MTEEPEKGAYAATYAQAADEPEVFWARAANGVAWQREWDRVLETSEFPSGRWFTGALLNTCHNAVDRHVEAGHGELATSGRSRWKAESCCGG